ncbi:MAG: hypothetical protein ACFBSC_12210 [Microcoleaceae cyanobacterium]
MLRYLWFFGASLLILTAPKAVHAQSVIDVAQTDSLQTVSPDSIKLAQTQPLTPRKQALIRELIELTGGE